MQQCSRYEIIDKFCFHSIGLVQIGVNLSQILRLNMTCGKYVLPEIVSKTSLVQAF